MNRLEREAVNWTREGLRVWSPGTALMEKTPIEEDAAEDDWPNLGAGETWPRRRRRVKGVKLGLSRFSYCLVLLPHSAPFPPDPGSLILTLTLQYYWEIQDLPGMVGGTGLGIERKNRLVV